MNRFIRLISLIMVVAVLLAVPVFSEEETAPKASHYIMRTCVYLDQIASIQFNVWYEVIALGIMDEVGAYSIRIQESTDGQTWTTVKTFYASDTPSMVLENDMGHSGYVTYTGYLGRYYRAKVIFFARNGNGEGQVSHTTEIIRL